MRFPMTADVKEKLAYSIAEAASAVGVSKDTIQRAIATGDLAVRYVGSKRVVLADELGAWLHALPSERAPR